VPRLLAIVEYDGTDFEGFQVQYRARRAAMAAQGVAGMAEAPGTGQTRPEPPRTVQRELERALAALAGTPVRVVPSGRTDSGVHAAGQAVHFDLEIPLARDLVRLQRAINAHLPADVAVRGLRVVPPTFHARFSAISRTYCYHILNGEAPSPLMRRYTYHVRATLSIPRMAEGAAHLVGSHDFVAFAAQEGSGSTRREVMRAVVTEQWANPAAIWQTDTQPGGTCRPLGETQAEPAGARLVTIEVEANAFLRHMMRRIAGTLIRVGEGQLEPGAVGAILRAKDKALAGPTAPARGLCLERVTYRFGDN